jgi:hypothetical protein
LGPFWREIVSSLILSGLLRLVKNFPLSSSMFACSHTIRSVPICYIYPHVTILQKANTYESLFFCVMVHLSQTHAWLATKFAMVCLDKTHYNKLNYILLEKFAFVLHEAEI